MQSVLCITRVVLRVDCDSRVDYIQPLLVVCSLLR